MRRYSCLAATLAVLLVCLLQPGARAATLQERLIAQPAVFGRDQLVGRWRLVAQREGAAPFEEAKTQSYIYLVTPQDARADEIELHSDTRKWITEEVSAPKAGRISARFEYYPTAIEISSAIPATLHAELEGNLKWSAQLEVHASARAPILKMSFFPGEVRWAYDRISGEVTSHEIIGEGEPRELIYTFDPVVAIDRAPTQRVEVLSFLGPEANIPEGGTVTPQVLTSIPGQKIYPQVYLDEALAKEKGRKIQLTITGEQSGETVTLPLESRGVPFEGEMRYGIGLSRAAHPLGQAMTLSPRCGGLDPFLYPPILSWQWVNEFFASDNLSATTEKGSCVSFDGISGETVRFSIDDETHFRVQWYARWEDLVLASYRTHAEKIELAVTSAGGGEAEHVLGMINRFEALLQSDSLTLQQKLAVGAVYFGPARAEAFATGIIRWDRAAAQSWQQARQNNRLGRAQMARYYGLQGGGYEDSWEDLGRPARDFAASLMLDWDENDPRIWLERYSLDEALMVSSARQLDVVMDTLTRDGMRTMVNMFHSVNLGGKVYSMFAGVDAFGNPLSDEAYWLNIVDVASELVVFGATVYEATAPVRFHKAGTGGKVARLTDGLEPSPGQAFKGRMRAGRSANARHFTARDPSGLSQVIDAFETLSDSFPATIRQGQRQQIVINAAPAQGPAFRLLPEPQNPTVPVRVTPRRRATLVTAPADPITEFGATARIAHQAPAQYRAGTPKAPDAVAGNFILMRQTGRTLSEAQGRAQLVMAMESLSDGQGALASGVLSFGRTEPVPASVFSHRLEMQGIEVAHFSPETVNMATAQAAMEGGWTVSLQVKPKNGPQRRVVLTDVGTDRFGMGADVEFFDPTRGQVLRMDVDEFADMVVTDAVAPVTTYRARDPMQDARGTAPVAFPAVKLPEPATPQNVLPASVEPKANSYFRFQTAAGEQVIALGDAIADGAINGVFRAAGREGQVVRISLNKDGNTNQVINDWFGRSFLAREGIDPDVIAPIKLHHRRVVAEGPSQLQVLELVDEFSGTLANDLVKQQGGHMTKGQAAAYVAAAREINNQGGIWLDGHLNNFTFIQTGDDTWKVQIFDPGGIYPVRGKSSAGRAARARDLQTKAWAPEDTYLKRFEGNPSDIEEGFRADFISEHSKDIATEDMRISQAQFFEFDLELGLPANLRVSFQQPDVRTAINASR